MAKIPQMPAVQYDQIVMQGGMDEVTPMLTLPTGLVRSAMNFECSLLGGYSRIDGYERYNGKPSPSDAVPVLRYVTSFVNIPSVGQTITGFSSGATAYILEVGTNYLATTTLSGIFTVGETLKVGATVIGVLTNPSGAVGGYEAATHQSRAADYQRSQIAAVPGTGPILGVFVYNDIVYAFRANAGGTAAELYKSSVAGWVNVPLLYEIYFTSGSTMPTEGATLTQGSVTATIKRVVTQNAVSNWSSNAAIGKLIITAPAGGNFSTANATYPGGHIGVTGLATPITFIPGGKFEVDIGNFSGQSNTLRAYGCDGVNRCWEFDETVLVPIDTGFLPDAPNVISIHKNFLFVGVSASLGFCAPGLPYDWTSLDGAGVLAVGDNITNMLELPGAQTTASMGVWARGTTFILYGVGASTWNLVPLNTGCGAIPYTAQNMAHTYVLDDRGVIDMQETLNYGNFDIDTITYRVNPEIARLRTLITGSVLNRHLSQYRIFASDGSGLYITNLHGNQAWQNIASGVMPVLFPNPVNVVFESKLSNGDEVIFFGSSNGFVYQLDKGTSFDGLPISAHLEFGHNHCGSPRILKRFRRAMIDVVGSSYFTYDFGYALDYGRSRTLQPNYSTHGEEVLIPQWDSFTWDAFTWDGTVNAPGECDMNGTSTNYAMAIRSYSALYSKFTVSSAVISYSNRRNQR